MSILEFSKDWSTEIEPQPIDPTESNIGQFKPPFQHNLCHRELLLENSEKKKKIDEVGRNSPFGSISVPFLSVNVVQSGP